MAKLRFLADMNISPQTVEALRQSGWDIVRVSTMLPFNATDQEILELARQEGMIVVTQDLDFSMLLALSGYDRPSLVTLRLSVADPEAITKRILETLPQWENSLEQGCAVTLDDRSVRIRSLPIS